MNDEAKAATAATRELTDDEIRERVIRLAFDGDAARFGQFMSAIREAIPPTVTVVLRGSAVIGCRWADGAPFDADGPGTSDLDLTLVGGNMLALWKDDAMYIRGLHSVPLSDECPDVAPDLLPLRRALCRIAGRPVNIQATSGLVQYVRDVLLDQPYHVLIHSQDREHEREAWEKELEARRAEAAASPCEEPPPRDPASPGRGDGA